MGQHQEGHHGSSGVTHGLGSISWQERRLRGFMLQRPLPSSCLGGLRLPLNLKLFWCCLTTKILQIISSHWSWSGMMLIMSQRFGRHGTIQGSSGAFWASQTQESAGWRPLWDDVHSGGRWLLHHLLPPLARHQTAWFYFAVFAGPSPRLVGQHVGPLEHLIPAALCPQDTSAKGEWAFSWQTWLRPHGVNRTLSFR